MNASVTNEKLRENAKKYMEVMECDPSSYGVASWACRNFNEEADNSDWDTTKYLDRLIRALITIEKLKP